MAYSTNGGLRAWKFDDLSTDVVAHQMGWKQRATKSELAALRNRHADITFVDSVLAELSVPSLAILAVLVDMGGVGVDRDVLGQAEEKYGLSREILTRSIGPLLSRLLMVVTVAGYERSFALVEPSAPHIGVRLRDADVPLLPDNVPFDPSDSVHDGRTLLAACAALGQFEVKYTQSGTPHRGAIKRIAKAIAIDEETLDELVRLGLDLDVLVPTDDDVIRPVWRRLRELATGQPRGRQRVLGAFVQRLRQKGAPVPTRAVDSWSRAAYRVTYQFVPSSRYLGWIPGIRRGKVGEIDVLCAEPCEGVAAASITPSFELFLPPESRPEHVVDVLAYADVVRIDRVLVARISKASIQRAASAGATAASIVASLRAASRTPIPQNVESAIADWAGIDVAVTARGRVIVVPIAEEVRIVAHLAPYAPRVIAPGVIIVGGDTPIRALSSALGRIGVSLRSNEVSDYDADDDDANDGAMQALGPVTAGDPAMQRRFAAYRSGDASELAKVAASVTRNPAPTAGRSLYLAKDDDDGDDAGFASDAAMALVEEWEDARGFTLSDETANIAATLIDAISPFDRKFVLAAKTSAQLEDRIKAVLLQRGGLEALLKKHGDVFQAVLGADVDVQAFARGLRSGHAFEPIAGGATSSGSPDVAQARVWHVDDLYARLVAGARTYSTFTLDLGGGNEPTVRIRKVTDRGRVTMILGDNVRDDSAIAVPLEKIVRIAEVTIASSTDNFDTINASNGRSGPDAGKASGPTPWRPLIGQSAPAGHISCPCGSGVRYRSCCRPRD